MITFKQEFYVWDDVEKETPAEVVEMSTYDEIECRDLVEFFSRFAKALGYSPNNVYEGLEEYLINHKEVK